MELLALFLLFGITSAENVTQTEREPKVNAAIFSVIQFPNSACAGGNGLNGTCYTASECTAKGGTASGKCAQSFGVCCTFSLACGASSSENNTYAVINSYSTTSDSDPCIYTFCKLHTDICKLRIDFETMEIASPTEYSTQSTDAGATQLSAQLGSCDTDRLTISNPGGARVPVICGYNTGQHMYLDASDACTKIQLDIDTGTTTTRKWKIKVTQYSCDSQNIPVEDCLQWFTGTSGTFASFNFDTSATTVSTTGVHLQNQYYDVCFRRERSKCSICFTPQIVSSSSGPLTSFGISASGSAPAVQSAVDSQCAFNPASTSALGPALTDYISVVNLQPPPATTNTAGITRICGPLFNAKTGETTAATACSFSTPFKWGVHFDDHELVAKTELSGTYQTAENVAPGSLVANQGQGFTGFYMAFWQNSC